MSKKSIKEINSEEILQEIISDKNFSSEEKLILGGGSNILFTKNYDGIVLKNDLHGIELVNEDERQALEIFRSSLSGCHSFHWDDLL